MLSTIQGTTDVYLIPGDPVAQVRAPEVFNLIFRTLGINAVLVPVHVAIQDIEAFVRNAFLAKNVKGMLLTIPHKSRVMGLLSHCNDAGRVAGAVNGIRRNATGEFEGALFDGKGFALSLDYFGVAYAGRRVLILGAGGAASAIAAALAMAGSRAPAAIALYDPAPGKAQALASQLAAATQMPTTQIVAASSSDPSAYEVVVNASPLGLKAGDPLPCDVSRLAPHAAVMDIQMKNQPTPLVQAARARHLLAQPGFEMLVQQAPDYLAFFGYTEAAQAVRKDATFIRELLYPAAMRGEIRRPGQPIQTAQSASVPVPGVGEARLVSP
ncbi:shikimate dehydrogenase family protein [Polaromonas jejuensis]|uniref:Shikimate dehydrogenase family protein n=1 Tax=Polaromonas jejuensis TaxID=457502 RepID=A0ABW0QA98_9BURK|nr:shikimate dehydrogenase [Polaromonas jejuensis]